MDWFERITGFREGPYAETQRRLSVVAGNLHADGKDSGYAIGRLEILSLADLRARATKLMSAGQPLQADVIQGDVRKLHAASESGGAVFQVASQFNLLEMVGPDVTPEDGVTRYAYDRTQGPACAIAGGAGTIYRNYLLPVAGGAGQTRQRQVDCLLELGKALGNADSSLWKMRNGYALATEESLERLNQLLRSRNADQLDELRALVRVGVQWNVQVTDPGAHQMVTQVYCSALPVAYCRAPAHLWAAFAKLVLEAAYEATLLAAVLNRAQTGNRTVFLTRLGGGAFGNEVSWIHLAISRAMELAAHSGLLVRLNTYAPATQDMLDLVQPYRV
ncbi:hypothetical protein [Ramlibacter sp.]|uniref:hypothetical protein n=1 Tax=Ramlibacter sp. TaxID=1917967 RepID=UPI002D39E555|nr:hypothetical protein [Ramlibacter sp.]HYD77548.1 hypothetical protein [Ramlibacter sp.]